MKKDRKLLFICILFLGIVLIGVFIFFIWREHSYNAKERMAEELSYFCLYGFVGEYADYDGEQVELSLNAKGESSEKIVIPDYVNGVFDVTLNDVSNLRELVIGNGITEMKGVREAWGIEKIVIGEKITKIDMGGFTEHHMLKEVIAEGVKELESHAFSGCKNLTKITLSKRLETIGHMAFMDCSKLTSIALQGSNICIDSEAFQGCTNLSQVEVIGNIKEIKDNAFCNTGLKWFDFTGVKYIGGFAFFETSLEKIFIPKSVVSIGWYAFTHTREIYVEFFEHEIPERWDFRWNESKLPNMKVYYGQTSF